MSAGTIVQVCCSLSQGKNKGLTVPGVAEALHAVSLLSPGSGLFKIYIHSLDIYLSQIFVTVYGMNIVDGGEGKK